MKHTKFFSNDPTNTNPVMLKVLIERGSRVLFVTPFAEYPGVYYEMEILTSSIQLLRNYNDNFVTNIAYNNINNTSCLSLDARDKIQSYNLINMHPEYSDMITIDANIELPFRYNKDHKEKDNLNILELVKNLIKKPHLLLIPP